MSNSNKFLFLFIALIFQSQISAASQEKTAFRIINGEPCDTTEVPFFVLVASAQTCGGCLISYRLVLSAAHCVISKDDGVTSTVHSGHPLPKFEQIRYFKDVFKHPKFDKEAFEAGAELRYDIAIIVVNEPFLPSITVQVVKIPDLGYSEQCSQAMTAGIGLTSNDEDDRKKPTTKRPLNCANLNIIDIHTCQKSYTRATIDDNFICTNQTGKDTCEGDSGGPLICNDYVIGIVSHGSKPCAGFEPAINSRVEKYSDFISDIMSQYPEILSKRGGVNANISKNAFSVSKNTVQAWVANWKFVYFTLVYLLVCYNPLTQ